ncbi:hypothetical protein SAMN05421636_101589 [Pricia antarctica]|uniref:Uncharacterized protein n=1 Tax=Pricia antarctica TaxID=641691 RepID=A0A1G6XAA7_9FLAO|nr:hypothetical protein [Pricia antarctica]SDD74982.1 hypothetical protein SAMN05421636_101589 [Pricia antarctica]
MDPFSMAWFFGAIFSGILGGRADTLLCNATNKLVRHISQKSGEPANKQIQKGVRKSYLQATLLAVDHLDGQRTYTLKGRQKENLKAIKHYLNKEIVSTGKEDSYLPVSEIDGEYRRMIFSNGSTSKGRKAELIGKFKEGIIRELENQGLLLEQALQASLRNGWKVDGRDMDLYKLTCAFFTQELNDNTQLTTFLQTEYLDSIVAEIGDLSVSINAYFEQYTHILPYLKKILPSIENIKENLSTVPEKTANLVIQGIKDQVITSRQVTVSDDYQKFLKELEDLETIIQSINVEIDGLRKALTQVDKTTKGLLRQTIKKLKTQLLQKSAAKVDKEQAFNEFVSNVINLAKQLKTSEGLDSSRLEKARALFEEGKYNELNEVLSEQEIDKDIARYKENGRVLANELTIKAQTIVLTKSVGWYEEADRLYAKAMVLIENYNTTYNYAYFLAEHMQINRAASIYVRALIYISNDSEKATILNSLANQPTKLFTCRRSDIK